MTGKGLLQMEILRSSLPGNALVSVHSYLRSYTISPYNPDVPDIHGGKVGSATEHRSGIARDLNLVRNHFKAQSASFEHRSTAPFSIGSTARPRDYFL